MTNHVHISKGNPCSNATKVWLTKGGGCFIANNNGRIPETDFRKILKLIKKIIFISFQKGRIIMELTKSNFTVNL